MFRLSLPLGLAALLLSSAAAHAADPDALWKIVHDKCVPNEMEHGDTAPCAVVDLRGGVERGYVVLKDLVGDTQYLVMPTAKITGIEDPAVLAAGAANYFADAWRERHYTVDAAKVALPREALSLAVNSAYGRTQNQLHIHIDCVRPDVRAAIARQLSAIHGEWTPLAEPLVGRRYKAVLLPSAELDGENPFLLLADHLPGAREAMGRYTLVVLGVTLSGGAPGFVILTDEADAATGDRASGEELQDHNCALAHP